MKRHFIVVYMYQLDNGVTGQGQLSIRSRKGHYVNISDLVESLNEDNDLGWKSEVNQFVLLNVLELNKHDFTYYTEHSKFKKNEKL